MRVEFHRHFSDVFPGHGSFRELQTNHARRHKGPRQLGLSITSTWQSLSSSSRRSLPPRRAKRNDCWTSVSVAVTPGRLQIRFRKIDQYWCASDMSGWFIVLDSILATEDGNSYGGIRRSFCWEMIVGRAMQVIRMKINISLKLTCMRCGNELNAATICPKSIIDEWGEMRR